jgi:5'-phosphate synthase pdxT subunit
MDAVRIGVLALQGDFAAHAKAIHAAGAEANEVRRVHDLADLKGLIIPGGESTTLLRLIGEYGFETEIPRFVHGGGRVLGTCAGLILLAREVENPPQPSLGLLDVRVRRNAYGRQIDSFVDTGTLCINGGLPEPAEMVFIRAPRIVRVGEKVEVIGELNAEPTLVRQGRIWAATFHPELSASTLIHRRFIEAVCG